MGRGDAVQSESVKKPVSQNSDTRVFFEVHEQFPSLCSSVTKVAKDPVKRVNRLWVDVAVVRHGERHSLSPGLTELRNVEAVEESQNVIAGLCRLFFPIMYRVASRSAAFSLQRRCMQSCYATRLYADHTTV